MNNLPLALAVRNLVFPGSAIICGKSADGQNAVTAYFISGLNDRERNRVFTEDDDGVTVRPFTGSVTPENTARCVSVTPSGLTVNGGAISGTFEKCGSTLNLTLRLTKLCGNTGAAYTFEYSNVQNGSGFLLTALSGSDYPFSPFEGEPVPVEIDGSVFDVVADIWENLRHETRVSLWVKSTDLKTGKSISRIINRNR